MVLYFFITCFQVLANIPSGTGRCGAEGSLNQDMPVCLLTNTFKRLLAGRWSVFWPSYLCFALK